MPDHNATGNGERKGLDARPGSTRAQPAGNRRTWKPRGRGILRTLFWLGIAAVALYPLLWTLMSSVKGGNEEIFGQPFRLPHQINWQNYQRAFQQGQMGGFFLNSLWVTGLTAWFTVVLGAWAGFALSKSSFPRRRLWIALFFVGLVLPIQSFLIPLIDLVQAVGIHDSLWALILPYTAMNLPVAVLLFSAYFRSVPLEIEEAARLDGASTARFYFGILLPVARPAVGTVVVLSCLNTWNEFLMVLLLIVNPAMKTLPAGMIAFEQAHNTDYPALLAGLSLIAVPTLIAYALFHTHIMRGVTAGAVK